MVLKFNYTNFFILISLAHTSQQTNSSREPRAITGHPKMSFLHEVISTPALIMKPRFVFVVDVDDLG